MKIVVWSDKGGVGKSTLATSLSVELGSMLIDLDPQGDATRWAERQGVASCAIEREGKGLVDRVKGVMLQVGDHVVDCPPGQTDEALTAVAMADLLIIPARTGDSDMVALGRALDMARRVRGVRPSLKVGVVLNLSRETGRARGVEAALSSQSGTEFKFLGRLSTRVGVEESFASGKSLLCAKGAASMEFKHILDRVRSMISRGIMDSMESMTSKQPLNDAAKVED